MAAYCATASGHMMDSVVAFVSEPFALFPRQIPHSKHCVTYEALSALLCEVDKLVRYIPFEPYQDPAHPKYLGP